MLYEVVLYTTAICVNVIMISDVILATKLL